MSNSATTRTPVAARTTAAAAVGALAWIALGASLLGGLEVIGVTIALVLVAVAATALAIVGTVRARPAAGRGPLVVALTAPMIALAAMTPLFRLGGALVFGVVSFVFAAELAVLAVVSLRRGRRA
ncbi:MULTISPECIES: hypothetical protein [unclassified Rathayibacter]|jgi:hypothetical protein|uniref:hypothetical protein n=1 Tax=unclassified Rathayibacter TaxID=2609250 RepID=UPI000CE80987|nr:MULTISPECIES: hypothetical protein [unclassified Rathayibacter]PPG50069.1 hypothetical protein C5C24_10995 [Rathayibacter sp. AY2B3]PPI20905.1 hypothetical protein C5D08_09665 [Rathayibacter sp. AY1B6]PPI20968.1 hypothetical protein C5D44_15740 [Rathayibacter sp. AY1B5]PPI38102.1 hypothetical protein C5D34_02960 [Rathayibacter sp. AY1B1]